MRCIVAVGPWWRQRAYRLLLVKAQVAAAIDGVLMVMTVTPRGIGVLRPLQAEKLSHESEISTGHQQTKKKEADALLKSSKSTSLSFEAHHVDAGQETNLFRDATKMMLWRNTAQAWRQGGYAMNLVDAYVTKVVGKPEIKYGKWFVRVVARVYGATQEAEIMCHTKEEADKIAVGHHFLT